MVRKVQSIVLIVSLLLCSGLASCGNGGNKFSKVPALSCTDRTAADTSNSYEVSVPERSKPDQTFPLLVILDPHGSGKTALAHFKLAAERYPAVLVASNKVKNDLPGYEAVIQALITDVKSKYPVGPTVCLSGFSGGARMAVGYATGHPVNGLILSGALAGAQELQQVGCLVYAISGTDDFNFMETAQYLFQDASTPSNLKIELTRSSHGWPDSLTLADGYGYLRLSPGSELGAEPNVVALSAFKKRQTSKIDSLEAKGSFIMARWTARNMTPFQDSFGALDARLKASPGYADEMRRLLQNLQMEAGVRDSYMKAFDSKDAAWWKNELAVVNGHIQAATDPFTQDAYRRIKGFWGIACYSLCNRAVSSGDFKLLNHYVSIYRILEPQNPDMLRFAGLLQ